MAGRATAVLVKHHAGGWRRLVKRLLPADSLLEVVAVIDQREPVMAGLRYTATAPVETITGPPASGFGNTERHNKSESGEGRQFASFHGNPPLIAHGLEVIVDLPPSLRSQ